MNTRCLSFSSHTLKRKVCRLPRKTTDIDQLFISRDRAGVSNRLKIYICESQQVKLEHGGYDLFMTVECPSLFWTPLLMAGGLSSPRGIIQIYPVLLQQLMMSFTSSPPGATLTPPTPPSAPTSTPLPPAAYSCRARIYPRLPTAGEARKTEAKAQLAHLSQNTWRIEIYEDHTDDYFGNCDFYEKKNFKMHQN